MAQLATREAESVSGRSAESGAPAGASATLPGETLKRWLHDMQLIREFETRTMQAYQSAKIGGFCHIYTGQEAVAVGTINSLDREAGDPIVTAYRDHGHALAAGSDPRYVMAEMYGKLPGVAKGKGGSMHMFDRPNHLYGGHGIVGAQTPLGAGLAFACKYEHQVLKSGPKRVALCYLGDGAVDQGAFAEALNLAALYSLPVIYVIENNGYSMGTAIHRHSAMADQLVLRGKAYGIHSVEIDGFDVLSLYDHFKPVVDMCRAEQKPAFVDMKTYRYQGHSMSDPQKYRTKDEVEQFKGKDSIAKLVSDLMARGIVTEDDWKQMQNEIRDVVRDAVQFAEDAPVPTIDAEMFSDVYAHPEKNLSPHAHYHHGSKNVVM